MKSIAVIVLLAASMIAAKRNQARVEKDVVNAIQKQPALHLKTIRTPDNIPVENAPVPRCSGWQVGLGNGQSLEIMPILERLGTSHSWVMQAAVAIDKQGHK